MKNVEIELKNCLSDGFMIHLSALHHIDTWKTTETENFFYNQQILSLYILSEQALFFEAFRF